MSHAYTYDQGDHNSADQNNKYIDSDKCSKKNNLDAIHDTVHEMAKDEARHGRALKGLLERYFK